MDWIDIFTICVAAYLCFDRIGDAIEEVAKRMYPSEDE
jgi:hypothetical protein